RRFFDINELAALNQDDVEVFVATHELVLRLLSEGKVAGLRVDHPDGLYNPKQYLQRLQQYFVCEQARKMGAAEPWYSDDRWQQLQGPLLEQIGKTGRDTCTSPRMLPLYVVVEKILEKDEPLRADWPVYGTSGYEFLNALNGLFVDGTQATAF